MPTAGSQGISAGVAAPPPTRRTELDAGLAQLQARKTEWARLAIPRKIELLGGLKVRTAAAAERWVDVASAAKGLPPGSPLRGEEWLTGPVALLYRIDPLRQTLEHAANGTLGALVAGRVRQRPDGQTVVRVMPAGLADRLMLSGYTADVWMQPGVTPETVIDTMAELYRQPAPEAGVALVLGAGNIASIPPTDVLYKLYAEGRVCVLKMNPVNATLGPVFEEIFGDFVQAGYVRIAYGAADVGEYLARHAAVDEIHLTGSAATHDAVVFGTGEEGRQRKERDDPVVRKPVTSELGGVSPIVVLPGTWSRADLRLQAEHVATIKMHNGGFNCAAGQVLVLPAAWPQREAFLAALRQVLREVSDRPAYYPGAAERLERACAADVGGIERFGAFGARVLLSDVSPEQNHPAFRSEFFSGVLAITSLPGGGPRDDAGDFLRRAIDFCNDRLAGTLSANLLAHPRTLQALGETRVEEALARLRYGAIGVNVWSALAFLYPRATWGAFPGHTRADIQSGRGVVNNALLFGRPQKTVAYGPFAPFPRTLASGELHVSPKPMWFVTNRSAAAVARAFAAFLASPGARRLPGLFAAALRGR